MCGYRVDMTSSSGSADPMDAIRVGRVKVTRATRAIAVLLHGGRAEQPQPRRFHDVSYLRMAPFVGAVRKAGDGHVAPVLVHNSDGGWVASSGSGVRQARAVIDRLFDEYRLPVVLLGHSSGGWVALRAGDSAQVLGSVALAPWIGPQDPTGHLQGKVVRVIHGEADRVCSPQRAQQYVEQLRSRGVDASYRSLPGGHALLENPRRWHTEAAGAVAAIAASGGAAKR